jgi:Site-specific recombinase XerD
MPRVLPLYVTRETSRHGTVRFYFRIGKGERTRLPGTPGSKEFKLAYKAAMAGEKIEPHHVVVARSLRWLVQKYMESATWSQLSVATRKQRGLFFKQVVDASGNVDCRAVKARDIRNALERRKNTPALANNFLKSMSALFKWALEHEHINADPTVGVKRLKNQSSGFPVWTLAEVQQFLDHWPIGTRERLAFEILIASGLRRSDVVRAGKQHMADAILNMRTMKTNTPVTVEFSQRVLDLVEKTQTGDLSFVVGKNGRPMTKESFGNWFREACRAAGIAKSAHGLRKFSATLAAEAGATTHQLMAQFGWVTTQQAELYTKGADRARLGKATSRIVAEQIEIRIAPHPHDGAGIIQNNSAKSEG